MSASKKIGIIGAGPAGLTAAYILTKEGMDVTVLEAHPTYVGGISRTEHYKDFYFDIGGHRFFSKSKEVEDLWVEILGDDLITRNRKSRILYKGKLYSYPLKPFEALSNLGIVTSTLCMLSYMKAKVFRKSNPSNFEEWVSNEFGSKLYSIFFKTYTEKVWGMNCSEISADWAAQRIKGLSLGKALMSAFKPKPKEKGKVIKTLIEKFRYPRKGPGMMWEKCRDLVEAQGGRVIMNTRITGIHKENQWTLRSFDGQAFDFDEIISSMPLRHLIENLKPSASEEALQAASEINYRDFLTVVLIAEDKDHFDDNWLYIHDDSVQVGRIQNFKAWSPEMVPDEKFNCYGLEYFCFEGDGLWTMSDEDLITLGKKEMGQMNLMDASKITDGYVVRQPKAYPVYNESYQDSIQKIKKELTQHQGLQVIGRNGMHKYNNQDHSMMTAMLAAQNILLGENKYNLWQVNEDAEYHESGDAGEESFEAGRMIPKKA